MNYSERRDAIPRVNFSDIGDINTLLGAQELLKRATAHLEAIKALDVRSRVDAMFEQQQQQSRPGQQRPDSFSL